MSNDTEKEARELALKVHGAWPNIALGPNGEHVIRDTAAILLPLIRARDEAEARALLSRATVGHAEELSSGDVVELANLLARVDALETALRFYADRETYIKTVTHDPSDDDEIWTEYPITEDRGNKARAALESAL